MPHSDKEPAAPRAPRRHNEELELRMAKEGFVNPSRVAEIMRLQKPTVYRWLDNGHVSKRELRGRVFAEVKTLHTFIRDPVMSAATDKYLADTLAAHAEPAEAESLDPMDTEPKDGDAA